MQEPLLHALPDQNQGINRNVPNIARGKLGWYPRWWIISALLSSIVIVLIALIAPYSTCTLQGPFHFVCDFNGWNPIFQVLCIWALFGVFWLLAVALGVRAIEVPRREHERSALAKFFRSLSQFGSLHSLLLFYGLIAIGLLFTMWWMQKTTFLAFSFASIVAFVANCSFFQRISRRQRRVYLMLYGLQGIVGLFMIGIFHRFNAPEMPFLLLEGLLVLVGIIALFRPVPLEDTLTAQEILEESIRQSMAPSYTLRNMWPFNRFFSNRPLGAPPRNRGQGTP